MADGTAGARRCGIDVKGPLCWKRICDYEAAVAYADVPVGFQKRQDSVPRTTLATGTALQGHGGRARNVPSAQIALEQWQITHQPMVG
jgi:hypothetical protein